jgi:hypothetical protein
VGDDFGRIHEKRVLDEQRLVVGELIAEGGRQEPRPKLPLQLDRRLVLAAFVEIRDRCAIERVGAARGPKPRLDFLRRRTDILCCRQNAFEPENKILEAFRAPRHLQLGNQLQVFAGQSIATPFCAVGQNPDIAPSGLRGANAYIPNQLLDCLFEDAAASKIALDLDDGRTHLDVDPPPPRYGGFEGDNVEVAFIQLERCLQNELPDVRLHFGFRPGLVAAAQSRENFLQHERFRSLFRRHHIRSREPLKPKWAPRLHGFLTNPQTA